MTLPMPHYVDDNSLIGPNAALVDAEAERLAVYLSDLGVPFKSLKSRLAAARQLVLGFWWDSIARTRTLEKEKFDLYLSLIGVGFGTRSGTFRAPPHHLRPARDPQ